MKTAIYADYAATTPTDSQVVEAMLPFFNEKFGNPSSVHALGVKMAHALEMSAQKTARFFGLSEEEIYFTSGGTESNNLALFGVMRANRAKGNHLITSVTEHPSVLNCVDALLREGFKVDYLQVDSNGVINPFSLEKTITSKTVMVSIHLANSELGVIQDIKRLSQIAHRQGVIFHTDACQASAYLKLNQKELGYDLITINGAKSYGPKGIGVLAVRQGVPIFPILFGGGQQRSLRSGTENLPAIVGLSKALEIIEKRREKDSEIIGAWRDQLQSQISRLKEFQINVATVKRLPNHLSVTLLKNNNRNLVKLLDSEGIAASSASACAMRHGSESYVLRAIGLSSALAQATVRLTFGRGNQERDFSAILEALKKIARE